MSHDNLYHATAIFGGTADKAIRILAKARTPILCALCFAAGAVIAHKRKD